jgi:peptidoglycan/xylan/chitin deacetylase (PgdA/CDA1 family)
MRLDSFRVLAPLALLLSVAGHAAADCPGNPDALGTSRTIVVDPTEHGRIGTMDYVETLPLVDKEVVLTFDDGPLPPRTDRVLDVLAAECVRATFFIVGRMARAYPEPVRRIHREGHTIATHSMHHPLPFRALRQVRWQAEIENGIAATAAALGGRDEIAPFFRFPGLHRTHAVERHLGARGLMAWSADVPSDDWRRITPDEVVRRTLQRLEAKRKGILLLHDIQAKTVAALPKLLAELKARGYRVVHVQPASHDRPKTATLPEQWRPYAQPKPEAALISIAQVQNPDGRALMARSADLLCSLDASPPVRVPEARMPRRAPPPKRVAEMPTAHLHTHSANW